MAKYLAEETRKHPAAIWLAGLISAVVTVFLLAGMLWANSGASSGMQAQAKLALMDKYNMFIANTTSEALDGIVTIEKVYFLNDEDLVAPMPDPEKYGQTQNPGDMTAVIEKAARLLDGQELIFSPDITLAEGSKIKYYLDDTILAITWKEKVGRTVYTFSEVKIAHPSQFRRFLSGGDYGTRLLYTTTEMAQSVNAVTASSADYYSYRAFGNTVYNGVVRRSGDRLLDTCYVDENGDLNFTLMGEVVKTEDVEAYVKEHNIRFSLAFGPVLVLDGELLAKNHYSIGEAADFYSRAALCQQDKLHYMVVTANSGGVNMETFGTYLRDKGVKTAYALDGGQTATIVTGNERMNDVDYGGERDISDIIYFATAIPEA